MFRVAIINRSLLCLLLFVSTATPGLEAEATKLRQQINSSLYRLPLERQGEYALMLYRTTGNKDYLETARVTLYLAADRLQRFARNLRRPETRWEQVMQQGFTLPADIIQSHSDYLFYGFMVLPDLNRISQLAMMLKGEPGDKLNQAINAYDFKQGLTSTALISLEAPALADHVYALLNLDYGDYRTAFINALRDHYPDTRDSELSQEQLLNKWEGMAHLVIAASDQLQEPVNDPLLGWIPEYFINHKQLILEQSNPRVLAKIGLALRLTGEDESDLVEEITKPVAAVLTKATTEDSKFWGALLLDWQENYFPDPAIYRMSRFRNKLPYSLKPLN